jgi:hypothetical protein
MLVKKRGHNDKKAGDIDPIQNQGAPWYCSLGIIGQGLSNFLVCSETGKHGSTFASRQEEHQKIQEWASLREDSMGKYRPRHAPNLPTIKKIKLLAAFRERNRDKSGRPPTWTSGCKQLRIDHRTVRRHAPELLEKWDDESFHW